MPSASVSEQRPLKYPRAVNSARRPDIQSRIPATFDQLVDHPGQQLRDCRAAAVPPRPRPWPSPDRGGQKQDGQPLLAEMQPGDADAAGLRRGRRGHRIAHQGNALGTAHADQPRTERPEGELTARIVAVVST